MTDSTASTTSFWNKEEHKRILVLTGPMILANITTPLIGLVDTAVLGHMAGTHFLAGAAIGALIITQMYWICGFIRMSVTGLSAQAKGNKDEVAATKTLYQSLFLGLFLGILILFIQPLLLSAGIYLTEPSELVEDALVRYFNIRIWGAPASLMNLALIGWLIGQQKARTVMLIQVAANLTNAGLNILFVFGFGWQIEGVALASVIAEYGICLVSFYAAFRLLNFNTLLSDWFAWHSLRTLVSTNTNMLIRNIFLQLCLAFVTVQGARYGALTAATNAVLMQFFVLIALGLDGLAFAIEALVGEAKGQGSALKVKLVTYRGLFWSSIVAVIYALVFTFFNGQIISLLTNQNELELAVQNYLGIIVLIPILAHWCFLYDGVFVGLSRARAMRNSMLISSLVVFAPAWWVLSAHQNFGLWIALLAFLAARGITLGIYFNYLSSRRNLIY